MSSSKRNSYDNHSPIPDSEGDRTILPTSKERNNACETGVSNQDSEENSSPKIINKQQATDLNVSSTDLYNSNGVVEDPLTSENDDLIAQNEASLSVSSEQIDGNKKLSDSKSDIHLSPPAHVPGAGISTQSINLLNYKEDHFDRAIDNQSIGDSLTNQSPGSVSHESSLFPDNLSRSSESGKSVDIGHQKTPEPILLKSDVSKIEKAVKNIDKKKKSSWYNMLNPTYKSRRDDFKRIFKDLPESERLIVDYSCALQKDILVQGRLYISQNFICFYANIFRWETFVLIPCREITSMTKEKTARLIPNAIQITTESEKHFFTSFGARDKTFLMLFRIWQNVLLEQPMSSQELWHLVHYSYGEELGLTSDDDDYVPPLNIEEEKIKALEQRISKNFEKGFEKISESASDYLPDVENLSAESLLGINGSCEQLMLRDINEEPLEKNEEEDAEAVINQKLSEYPTDMSDTTESDENVEDIEVKCPCTSHEGKEVLNAVFPLSVDQVFSLVFSGSKFYYDLLASRKTYDIMESPWQMCPEMELKMRQVTYTLTLNHSMAKSAQTTETQRLLKHTKPGQIYTVDCDVVNTGIPYSDTFTVKSIYCLTRVSKKECRLRVFGCVRYKKSVWGLVKSLIEKSAMQGLADFATDLEAALNKEAECSSQQSSAKKTRRRKRIKIDSGKNDANKDTPRILQRQPTLRNLGPSISGFDLGVIGSTPDLVIKVILATLVVLLLLNMLLFYKLWSLEDQSVKQPATTTWDFPFDSQSVSREDVLQLLKKQDALHRAETERWRDVLSEVVELMRLIESSLSELRNSINTYSSTSMLKTFNFRNSPSADDANSMPNNPPPLQNSAVDKNSENAHTNA